jgi:hypothetical protein
MTRAVRVEQVLLWVFVILAGIVIGAGFYEMRVTVPLWAHSPPDSVWYWEAQRIVNPQYVPNSGARFWIFLTPAHTLLTLATFIAGLKMRGAHRKWVLISTAIFFLMHLTAFVWFVPTINRLARSRELGLSPEEVATTARLWVTLSWFRAPIGLVGFIAGLRALTIPPEPRARTGP